MPITGLALIPVSGEYYTLDGAPAQGTVTFTPSEVLVNTVANEIVYPFPFVIVLDANGAFSVNLPATNDPDLTPQGWTYTVEEKFTNTPKSRIFSLAIPYNSAGINLADVGGTTY